MRPGILRLNAKLVFGEIDFCLRGRPRFLKIHNFSGKFRLRERQVCGKNQRENRYHPNRPSKHKDLLAYFGERVPGPARLREERSKHNRSFFPNTGLSMAMMAK